MSIYPLPKSPITLLYLRILVSTRQSVYPNRFFDKLKYEIQNSVFRFCF